MNPPYETSEERRRRDRNLSPEMRIFREELTTKMAEEPNHFPSHTYGFHKAHPKFVPKPAAPWSAPLATSEVPAEIEEGGFELEECGVETEESSDSETDVEPAPTRKEPKKCRARKSAIYKQNLLYESTSSASEEKKVPVGEGSTSTTMPSFPSRITGINEKTTQTTWSGCGLFHMIKTSNGRKYHMFAEETKEGVKYNERGKPSRDEETQTNNKSSRSDDENAASVKVEKEEASSDNTTTDEEKKKNERKREPYGGICFVNRDEHTKKLHKEMRKKLQKIQIDPKMPKTLAANHFERAMKIIDLPVASDSDGGGEAQLDDSRSSSSDDETENKDGKVRTKEYFDWPNSLLTTTLTTIADAFQQIDCQCQEKAQRSPNEASGRDDTLKKVKIIKLERDGVQEFYFKIPDNNVLDNVSLKINRGAAKTTFQIEGQLNDRSEEERRVASAWRAIAKAKLLKYKRKLRYPDKFYLYGRDFNYMPPYGAECCSKHEKDELLTSVWHESEVLVENDLYDSGADEGERNELEAEIEEASKDLEGLHVSEASGPASRKSSSSSEGSSWDKMDDSEKSAK